MTPDLLLANAVIVDGSGEAAFPGWVAVGGDRIARIGRGGDAEPEAAARLDLGGAVLAPGFVDVHNHSDASPFVEPAMPSTVRQGVTTVVVGNCGTSAWPAAGADDCFEFAGVGRQEPHTAWPSFGDFLDAVDAAGPAVNVAALVGHGAVRSEVLGRAQRRPTATELDRMRGLVAEAMDAGATGLSTGLIYVPGMFSETDEVVALAEESARAGGIYASHIRGEGRLLFDAIHEALEVGTRAGLPVHVSHLKCESGFVHGRAHEALSLIAGADDASADQYPYAAWNSYLSSLLPPWAPVEEVAAIAKDPRRAERLRRAVEIGEPGFQSSVDGVGWDRIVVVNDVRWRGRDVAAIARELELTPFDALVRLLEREPNAWCTGHAMHEDDVRTILADPGVFVASDAVAMSPEGPNGRFPVHPREYGTFPRALARCRDEGLLPLESTVRKMTTLPADRFGLRDRGRIREKAFADLVAFDAARVRDRATFEAPHAYAEGIDLVVVNGRVAWGGEGSVLGRFGRALRRA